MTAEVLERGQDIAEHGIISALVNFPGERVQDIRYRFPKGARRARDGLATQRNNLDVICSHLPKSLDAGLQGHFQEQEHIVEMEHTLLKRGLQIESAGRDILRQVKREFLPLLVNLIIAPSAIHDLHNFHEVSGE